MNFLHAALAFLLALGPLIVFHELGHYWVARLCGVKVLRFSVGMGKVVWSRRVGPDQTEWAISALPLGGYVKMLDSRDPAAPAMSPADQQREFTRQNVWKRMAIIAAGPVANFVLAIVVFAGLAMHGVEEPGTRVRHMPDTTAAYDAGLRGGDQITAVNGNPVIGWSDLRWEFVQAVVDHKEAQLDVARDNAHVVLTLPASALAGLDVETDVLDKLGIAVARPPARLEQVLPGGQGEAAGLRAGDVITGIDGKPVVDGLDLINAVRTAPGRTLAVDVARNGETLQLAVTPDTDPDTRRGRIKVLPDVAPTMVTVTSGPIAALGKGAVKTWDNASFIVKMIGKMVVGEVSWKNVTGPITIADYASQSARLGAASFFTFIALISISLGVMNLLPIPVLDGGLLLYYSLEVLTGRPLPERVDNIVQRAGLGLLVMLMALAVFNDVARLL